VLETSVQMRLQTQAAHHSVVVAVDVRVDPVQALEDLADVLLEVGREGHAWGCREELCVGQVVAGPCEEVGDVGWRWEAGGFGERRRVVPEVFELVGGFHFGAGGGRAEFGDTAVEEVDLVVEVDDCERCVSFRFCQPVINRI